MGAHNGAVDHRVFIVCICREMLKDALPHSGPGPAAGLARFRILERNVPSIKRAIHGLNDALPVSACVDLIVAVDRIMVTKLGDAPRA